MTSDLTVHRGTQPVMLCSWIQRACRAVVRASLYLQRDGDIVGISFYILGDVLLDGTDSGEVSRGGGEPVQVTSSSGRHPGEDAVLRTEGSKNANMATKFTWKL